MADEAFALSPISARAAEPGEADYEAISAAFLETSRGRWFLGEYAKRNRNADTRMVLDAVARIEENLAAQRDTRDDRLPQALDAIRHALDEARATAAQAAAKAEASLVPIRNATQAIREILTRLREIGADGRIYDLMDSQVGVIEAGCGEPGLSDAETALNAAFDLIEQRISDFEGEDRTQPPASEVPAETTGLTEVISPPEVAAETAMVPLPEDVLTPAAVDASAEDDTAQDDAVLDIIALEMAAPDFAEEESSEFFLPQTDAAATVNRTEPPAALQPEPSLGASLIANGIIRTPSRAADPLAPIRRMSQAEKIAFFS